MGWHLRSGEAVSVKRAMKHKHIARTHRRIAAAARAAEAARGRRALREEAEGGKSGGASGKSGSRRNQILGVCHPVLTKGDGEGKRGDGGVDGDGRGGGGDEDGGGEEEEEEVEEDEEVGALREEISILERLPAHPNIIRMLAKYENDGHICLVLEMLRGGNLTRYLEDRGGTLVEVEAANILRQFCAALLVLHRSGVIHGDLTTDAVLVSDATDRHPLLGESFSP
jgi:serine/threonine protein kinase